MPKRPEQIPPLPKDWPVRGNGGQLIGTRATALLLGLDQETVSHQCAQGNCPIPHYKIGGVYQFDMADIRVYLDKQRIEPDPETAAGMR
jgi:hypothetical protein